MIMLSSRIAYHCVVCKLADCFAPHCTVASQLHQAREWEQALELWPLVLRAGITPDKRLLGLVITSYIRAGTPEKALRLLDSGTHYIAK
jgi:hypothetical protein